MMRSPSTVPSERGTLVSIANAAHPDVEHRVALSPTPLHLHQADGERNVGERRQPRRLGRTPGGCRLNDELRASVGGRSEEARYEELVSTVGEVEHGGGAWPGNSGRAREPARDFRHCGSSRS